MRIIIMNTINPVNPKYKARLNRAYKWLRAYHDLVNIDEPTSKEEKRQEVCFYKYVDIIEELPLREQKTFDQQHKKIHGYT
jgi:hypothetical protein